eukprot:gnl/Carplike_NY0171/6937_a9565_204.p1 GENE.gnl/Carplike_NY0171/6937_a9565_204~~gnl/Carplike_NY0171/6937_a9565_204.p1  ORF type:complete len:618 (+),score=119.69 gnl/Carplike_NY0171/6937_a9565_204:185-1855(+)
MLHAIFDVNDHCALLCALPNSEEAQTLAKAGEKDAFLFGMHGTPAKTTKKQLKSQRNASFVYPILDAELASKDPSRRVKSRRPRKVGKESSSLIETHNKVIASDIYKQYTKCQTGDTIVSVSALPEQHAYLSRLKDREANIHDIKVSDIDFEREVCSFRGGICGTMCFHPHNPLLVCGSNNNTLSVINYGSKDTVKVMHTFDAVKNDNMHLDLTKATELFPVHSVGSSISSDSVEHIGSTNALGGVQLASSSLKIINTHTPRNILLSGWTDGCVRVHAYFHDSENCYSVGSFAVDESSSATRLIDTSFISSMFLSKKSSHHHGYISSSLGGSKGSVRVIQREMRPVILDADGESQHVATAIKGVRSPLKVWDLINEKEKMCFYTRGGGLNSISLKNDDLCVGESDSTIKLFDIRGQKTVVSLSNPSKLTEDSLINSSLHDNGKSIVAGYSRGTVAKWDRRNLTTPVKLFSMQFGGYASKFAVHPSLPLCAASVGVDVVVNNLDTGKGICAVSQKMMLAVAIGAMDKVYDVVFHPNAPLYVFNYVLDGCATIYGKIQ